MADVPNFTPDLVYNLISNNPQGRAFVENLARMNQLQQQAQQFVPQLQQFAQNPAQAVQNLGNWAQNQSEQMQLQQAQQAQQGQQLQPAPPPTQPTQGGNMNNQTMLSMAMDVVNKIEKAFEDLNAKVDAVATTNEEILSLLTSPNKEAE